MKRIAILVSVLCLALTMLAGNVSVEWDAHSLIIDGKRVCPVMGEIHYSRVPADEWEAEVKKMKEGGVTIIATYVFWTDSVVCVGSLRFVGKSSCPWCSDWGRSVMVRFVMAVSRTGCSRKVVRRVTKTLYSWDWWRDCIARSLLRFRDSSGKTEVL